MLYEESLRYKLKKKLKDKTKLSAQMGKSKTYINAQLTRSRFKQRGEISQVRFTEIMMHVIDWKSDKPLNAGKFIVRPKNCVLPKHKQWLIGLFYVGAIEL